MKLSDYHGEEALDLFADLIEPAAEIMTDNEFGRLLRSNNAIGAIKVAIKNHKRAVIDILALLDGEDPKTYKVDLFTLPKKLLEIVNDDAMKSLFTTQGQKKEDDVSGSATENTEGKKG